MKRRVLTILACACLAAPLAADVLSFNSGAVRALSMGGALTAVLDSDAAQLYNPATEVHVIDGNTVNYALWADAIRIGKGFGRLTGSDFAVDSGNLALPLTIGISQFKLGNVFFNAKVAPAQQLFGYGTNDAGRPTYNEVSSIAGSLRAKMNNTTYLTIGGAMHFLNAFSGGAQANGYSLGAHLMMDDLTFGLFRYSMPDAPSARAAFEHIVDDSWNIGVAYYTSGRVSRFIFSGDLRDVTGTAKPHAGVEWKYYIDQRTRHIVFFARAGGFYDSDTSDFGYSYGGELALYYDKSGSFLYLRYGFTTSGAADSEGYHLLGFGATYFFGPSAKTFIK